MKNSAACSTSIQSYNCSYRVFAILFIGMNSFLDADNQSLMAVNYVCAECQADNSLKPKDAVRCRNCGHRVLYKKRCRNLMVFDAR
uniref:DNA-directed RNA polymerases I, II, and III subunit RPABC4 n=1 Tax=Steinernema glaseri TaxID=37863 RepID=A0A1I7YPM0_9BILA